MKKLCVLLAFIVLGRCWCEVDVIDSDPDNYCVAYSNDNSKFAYGTDQQKVIIRDA